MKKKNVGLGFGVLILKNNRILLGHRHEDPEKADSLLNGAGTWTMPGGKAHFGETFEEGAYREVLEETGIELDKNNLKLISVTNDMVEEAHFVSLGFLCKDFKGEPQELEPDEITEWKWFPLDQLPTPQFFPSKKVLKNFLDGEIYKH